MKKFSKLIKLLEVYCCEVNFCEIEFCISDDNFYFNYLHISYPEEEFSFTEIYKEYGEDYHDLNYTNTIYSDELELWYMQTNEHLLLDQTIINPETNKEFRL